MSTTREWLAEMERQLNENIPPSLGDQRRLIEAARSLVETERLLSVAKAAIGNCDGRCGSAWRKLSAVPLNEARHGRRTLSEREA